MFTVECDRRFCKEGRLVDPNSDPKFTKHWFQDGVRLEYSRNTNFNKKLYNLIGGKPRIMDIGCGGAQFILDCVNDGCLAVGLDGYEIYRRFELGAWPLIPNNVFEVDVSEYYSVKYGEEEFEADVITSWEMIEHLYEEDLDGVLMNIKTHLRPLGYFICGISTRDEYGHFLLRNYEWWINKFNSHSLYQQTDKVAYFEGQWVRQLEDSMYFVLQFGNKENDITE